MSTFGGTICTSLIYKYLFLAGVEQEVTGKVIKPTGSDALKQTALVVDAYNPKRFEI